MRRRALLAALGLVVAAIGAGAPPALAGTASVTQGTLVYTDTPGAGTTVKWARDADGYAISEVGRDTADRGTPTAGPGCVVDRSTSVSATFVCSAQGVTAVRIELGDGDDEGAADNVSSGSTTTRYFQDRNFPVTVLGGDGNDQITGGTAGDTIDGEAGDDHLFAYSSNDDSSVASAPDTLNGGPGNDTTNGGMTIDLGDGDDTAYSPGPGASIYGGGGNDNITGSRGDDTINGGDGNDVIDATDGNDTISGGVGDDDLAGGVGADQIDGGEGADKLDGGQGADTLQGGAGPDKIDGGTGADKIGGGPGDDSINAEDGSADTIDCGEGNDRVAAWDQKKDKAVPRESCEHIPEVGLDDRGSLVRGYQVAARTGKLKVRFHCVGCDSLRAGLQTFQFYEVPRKRGFALGSNCPAARMRLIKNVGIDQFAATLRLTRCQRRSLRHLVALERAGKAKLRIFIFTFRTPHSSGEANLRGTKRS
jgi:Ca2+-binding RTX toxin-like protein